MFAALLSAVPLQKIMRRPADAGGCGERAQTLLATLVLVADGPAQADESEENKGEELQQIGGERDSGVKRQAQVDAQQKGQQQNLQRLQAEEEISLDPEGPPGIALSRVPA